MIDAKQKTDQNCRDLSYVLMLHDSKLQTIYYSGSPIYITSVALFFFNFAMCVWGTAICIALLSAIHLSFKIYHVYKQCFSHFFLSKVNRN